MPINSSHFSISGPLYCYLSRINLFCNDTFNWTVRNDSELFRFWLCFVFQISWKYSEIPFRDIELIGIHSRASKTLNYALYIHNVYLTLYAYTYTAYMHIHKLKLKNCLCCVIKYPQLWIIQDVQYSLKYTYIYIHKTHRGIVWKQASILFFLIIRKIKKNILIFLLDT